MRSGGREGESSDVRSPQGADDPGWEYKRSDRSRRNGPLRRRFRDLRRRVLSPLVPLLVPPLLRGLGWTWRVEVANSERREEVLEAGDGCVAVLWHGRMAAAAPVFAGVNTVILVSMSGDGELANTTLERLGYRTLRGSSSRYGVRALKAMREMLRGGGAVAITPDGPRGPMHKVNRGAAFLARDSGLPIVPFGFAAGRAARLHSWDRFMIPLPFSRVQVVIADPIRVDPDATDGDLREVSEEIGAALVAAEEEAAALLGVEADW
ncbi:MAG: lysophospholipid acyltransferase family protein [Planctomycetota bacterium]|nr:lysophospholipid acyltransferase family protein [Planctomycetota bacterium]MDG1986210.1 lysophospholipid acyltransferase family protein [Planctomycetota bacterium]